MKIKYFIFPIIIGILLIINLGRILDISKYSKRVDIIVSLGGDNGSRIKKTLSLYENNMSKSGKIIITGVDNFDQSMKLYELDWRANYLIKKGIKKDNIIFNDKAENTLEEISFIKKYMLKYHLHTVMFITDPPHSRRINFFASTVIRYKDANISYLITATDNKWWHREDYYTNPEAVIYVVNESIKYVYYYLQYILGNLNEDKY